MRQHRETLKDDNLKAPVSTKLSGKLFSFSVLACFAFFFSMHPGFTYVNASLADPSLTPIG